MRAVNLIPGEQRAGEGSLSGRSGGGALIVLGLLLGVVALVLVYGHARHEISSQQGEAAQLRSQASSLEASTGQLASYTNFVTMAEQRVKTVSELIQSRFDWSHSLSELGGVLPPTVSLNSLHGSIGASGATSTTVATPAAGTTASSSTPPGSTPTFALTGCATSQSQVALALQHLRLMDGATEAQLQSANKSGTSGAGGASGSCPTGDVSFSVQVNFTGLPTPQSTPSATQASTATASAQGSGTSEPVSTSGKGAPR